MNDSQHRIPPASRPNGIAGMLAPGGTLRVAANLANRILFRRNAAGQYEGAALRIAAELAARLSLSWQVVPYASAGQVTQALAADEWDLGFLAYDPARSEMASFTRPYILIESTYLVRPEGPRAVEEVDAPGVRIAVARGAAYELHLARELRFARLVQATTPAEALALLATGHADALAGVRQALEQFAAGHQLRVLEGSFQTVQHAIAVPRRSERVVPWIDETLAELKRSGFVRQALRETGQANATLAP